MGSLCICTPNTPESPDNKNKPYLCTSDIPLLSLLLIMTIIFPVISVLEAMNGGVGAGLFTPVGLDRVSPGMVIDVASLILGGFHAVPVKLKMLLDRLFSLLSPEEITAVLRGFGWSIQDYQRGYILKVLNMNN